MAKHVPSCCSSSTRPARTSIHTTSQPTPDTKHTSLTPFWGLGVTLDFKPVLRMHAMLACVHYESTLTSRCCVPTPPSAQYLNPRPNPQNPKHLTHSPAVAACPLHHLHQC